MENLDSSSVLLSNERDLIIELRNSLKDKESENQNLSKESFLVQNKFYLKVYLNLLHNEKKNFLRNVCYRF